MARAPGIGVLPTWGSSAVQWVTAVVNAPIPGGYGVRHPAGVAVGRGAGQYRTCRGHKGRARTESRSPRGRESAAEPAESAETAREAAEKVLLEELIDRQGRRGGSSQDECANGQDGDG
jgi:hypothetical protein